MTNHPSNSQTDASPSVQLLIDNIGWIKTKINEAREEVSELQSRIATRESKITEHFAAIADFEASLEKLQSLEAVRKNAEAEARCAYLSEQIKQGMFNSKDILDDWRKRS